ncbi:Mut7-C RNAse domain-containing protein [Dehalococcoidia bacterium]|nr:Mut7-C RNAse domain-containing protein [Dehalococcoidia bacterium]
MKPKFIVDLNVGKLAKRLRMLGYDALFINGLDDNELVRIALKEGRVLLTKDTGILRRGVASTGKIKVVLIESENVREQLRQVVETLYLKGGSDPFSLCLECNEPLIPREKEEVRDLVPPYVLQTQEQYVQCPGCNRIYWRGTHWQRMNEELEQLLKPGDPFHNGETLASGGIP